MKSGWFSKFGRWSPVCMAAAWWLGSSAAAQEVPAADLKKISDALPKTAPGKPLGQRKLLVFSLTRGFHHSSIPWGIEALKRMGETTGAFEVVASDDAGVFEYDSLKNFDAVCMLNTTGELFLPPEPDKLPPEQRKAAYDRDYRLKQNLLNFVRNGKGIIGIHSATDTFYKWPEYGEMMGGYFDGHPWHESVNINVIEPTHPLLAMFPDALFTITDEIYQLKDPYNKGRIHELLKLDTASANMKKEGINRRDSDFAVSYVRNYAKGRVFYCSLGHREEVYWNPTVLAHYLAGIQFALGDLSADAEPTGKPVPELEPIFNGKDLTGWTTALADTDKRKKLQGEELTRETAAADAHKAEHWTVKDGVLCFDGKGDSLATAASYDDFEFLFDWKIEPNSDSGIYVRGYPQVQIWDATVHPEGSGGLYNNPISPNNPLVRADRPPGEWNSMRIRAVTERVTVWLNDQRVVQDCPLQNFWDPSKRVAAKGPVELQAHGTPICFRNLRLKSIPKSSTIYQAPSWFPLFNQEDLSYWTCKPGAWAAESATIKCKGGSNIYNDRGHSDYILDFEVKLAKGASTGVFVRITDTKDPEAHGLMLVLADEDANVKPSNTSNGALLNVAPPMTKVKMRPAGEWNTVNIMVYEKLVTAVINGERVLDIDLNQWSEVGKNPDGTTNPYPVALKNLEKLGFVGFKDSGDAPVYFRHVSMYPIEMLPEGLRKNLAAK